MNLKNLHLDGTEDLEDLRRKMEEVAAEIAALEATPEGKRLRELDDHLIWLGIVSHEWKTSKWCKIGPDHRAGEPPRTIGEDTQTYLSK